MHPRPSRGVRTVVGPSHPEVLDIAQQIDGVSHFDRSTHIWFERTNTHTSHVVETLEVRSRRRVHVYARLRFQINTTVPWSFRIQ